MRALAAAIVASVPLAGCGADDSPLDTTKNNEITEITVTLKDGRVLECIRFDEGLGNERVLSIDCNWDRPLHAGRQS